MTQWAAMAISRFRVGKDGKTAYERQRGARCKEGVVPFGERVWFRQASHGDGKKRSLHTKWQEGIWLGHCRESNESWVGMKDVKHTTSVLSTSISVSSSSNSSTHSSTTV